MRRRNACPGVLAPMAAGDGLLVRVRVPAGVLHSPTARRVAELASLHGNGMLELSQRATIQIRGVRPETVGPLSDGLADLGLVSDSPAAEAVRNVLCAPTAGLDPDAPLDVRPAALALDDRLAADAALHRLPAKFGFLLCGGGRGHLADSSADVRFDAVATPDGPRLRVAVGGTLSKAAPLGLCRPDAVPTVAAAAARAFLDLRSALPDPPRRMAGLIRAVGLEALIRHLHPTLRLPEGGTPAAGRRAVSVLGPQPGWYGVAFPFGQLSADTLAALAGLARELRLTPWRALLLVNASAAAVPEGIAEHTDPRLKLQACSGAPGCDAGTTATRADALAFASAAPSLMAGADALHVSGCAKGCAHPAAATITLTARDGRYDLGVRSGPGGPPLRRDLDRQDALMCIVALERLYLCHRIGAEAADSVFARLGEGLGAALAREVTGV